MGRLILEAPVFTIEAALLAATYGIDRIELCSNHSAGGETPSAGALNFLKQNITIPVFVMIRPRGVDFVYSKNEIQTMKNDIKLLSNLGADGFVFGALTPHGYLDEDSNRLLIDSAEGLPCTLHRAFDSTIDLFETLESAIQCGFSRILTSGGKNTVTEGLYTLIELLKTSRERIIIMPGGGLKPDHLNDLNNSGHLKEVHASCKGWRPSESKFFKPELDLTEAGNIITINKSTITEFQKKIERLP